MKGKCMHDSGKYDLVQETDIDTGFPWQQDIVGND